MDKTIFPEKAAERSIVHIMRVDFLSYSKYSPDKISGFRAVKGKSLGLLVAHILTVQKKKNVLFRVKKSLHEPAITELDFSGNRLVS